MVSDVTDLEQTGEQVPSLAIETELAHEVFHRLPFLAFEYRQCQRLRSPACLHRDHCARTAGDRCDRQPVIPNPVGLAVERLRRETVGADHRQHREMVSIAEVVRQLEAMAAGANHDRVRLVAGLVRFADED